MTWSINFTDENAAGEKGQMSCHGYKAKLVIAAGSQFKKKQTCSQGQKAGVRRLVEASRSEPTNSSAKMKSGCK